MLHENAKGLRKHMTIAERSVWSILRNNQLKGLKFRRQQPLGKYIVDFVCFEKKVFIEIDGGQHIREQEHDKTRTERINSQGYRVIRFWNNQVLKELEAVRRKLWNEMQ